MDASRSSFRNALPQSDPNSDQPSVRQTAYSVAESSGTVHVEATHAFTDMAPIPDFSEEERASLRGRRVVIVEDEGITQMQLRRCLTKAGLIVADAAINGREGVTAVLKERPDIVLMDIRMPVMDGIEAARLIMAEYRVCIVMLTAFSDDLYRDQADEIGTSGYIVKPITSDLLLPLMLQAYRRFLSKS